jgi:hypothetical protein
MIAFSVVEFSNNLRNCQDNLRIRLLSIKDFPHGEPEIGDYSQTDAEIEAYQQAHVKIPKI